MNADATTARTKLLPSQTWPTFFDNLDSFAEAPEGVAKLRELILDLAVRGKLVERDENNEPASELLERINNRRAELVDAGTIRRQAPMRSDALPDEPLPSGWVWANFGEVTFNRDGDRVPVRKGDREHQAKTYDYYGASGVIDKVEDFLFDQPLLLIGEDGANLINRSTPIAFIAEGKYWVNSHAHVLDTISRDMMEYLRVFINSISLEPYITGMAQPKMNQARMNSIPIAVPPEAEQRWIVSKVDGLMSLCDELESRGSERVRLRERASRSCLARLVSAGVQPSGDRQAAKACTPTEDLSSAWQRLSDHFEVLYDTPETLAHLRQSILQLAVQCKLVPQDPNDEPASDLLTELAEAKAKVLKAGRKKTTNESVAIDENEIPFELPSSWAWARVGDVLSLKHGYAFKSSTFTEEPTPFVLTTPGNFYETGGFRDRGSKTRFVDGPVVPEFIFETGDLMIPMTEQAPGLLGSPAFIPDDGLTYVHNQRLGKLEVFFPLISREFLFLFFNSPFLRSELAKTCSGTTVRHTSPFKVLKVLFPVCTLAEQKRIVAKVDQLLSQCDELSARLRERQSATQQLLTATIHHLLDEV